MKLSILSLCIVCSTSCILPAAARTPEQTASDLFALTNDTGVLRLEHSWDREDAFRAMLGDGMTPDELSSALVLAAESLADAKNPLDASSRRFAVSALGEFGTANALPFLEREMRDDGASDPIEVMWALVDLSERVPEAFGTISSALRIERRNDARLCLDLYARIDDEFAGDGPSGSRRKALVAFLLERTESETVQAGRLDELLCRVEPSFRESPERLRMAACLAEAELENGMTNGAFRALEASLREKCVDGASEKVSE